MMPISVSQEREKPLAQSTDPEHQAVRCKHTLKSMLKSCPIYGSDNDNGNWWWQFCYYLRSILYVSKKSETKVWKTTKLLPYLSHGENSKANYLAQPTQDIQTALSPCQVFISPLSTCAPAHTGDICYQKPLEAADKQDFRRQSHFLSHTPKTLP